MIVELVMDVERDEGELVGVTVNDQLVVVTVVKGSLAEGQMAVGDQITKVNDIVVSTKEQFFQKLRFAHPRLRLNFKRPNKEEEAKAPGAPAPVPPPVSAPVKAPDAPAEAPKALPGGIPEDQEKFLRRRTGFEYLLVELDWPAQQERQLGIVLANRMHKVIVGGLKPGSLGEEKLKVLDRVVAINGAPVSDKDIAKHLIVAAGGKFSSLIERPVSEEAKAENAIKTKSAEPTGPAAPAPGIKFNDVGGDPKILPHDCLLITKLQREALTSNPKTAGPSILKNSTSLRSNSKLAVADKHTELDIARDTPESKKLRRTPKLF